MTEELRAESPTKNDHSGGEEEGEPAHDPQSATAAATIPQPTVDHGSRDREQNDRAEQRKILREWLTIGGLFLAAAAAIYQGIVLSVQAGALKGQLEEMRAAALQTNKLIQSNADLAAAAKSQAIAEANSAATAHESLIMTERARITSSNASLQPLQIGQGAKGIVTWSNVGRESAPVDYSSSLNHWRKSEWQDGSAAAVLVDYRKKCFATDTVNGASIANPSVGFGNGYTISTDSNDENLPEAMKFSVDDDMIKGNTIITISSCFVYKTVSEIHHTASCYFYEANKTPNIGALNICAVGNSVD